MSNPNQPPQLPFDPSQPQYAFPPYPPFPSDYHGSYPGDFGMTSPPPGVMGLYGGYYGNQMAPLGNQVNPIGQMSQMGGPMLHTQPPLSQNFTPYTPLHNIPAAIPAPIERQRKAVGAEGMVGLPQAQLIPINPFSSGTPGTSLVPTTTINSSMNNQTTLEGQSDDDSSDDDIQYGGFTHGKDEYQHRHNNNNDGTNDGTDDANPDDFNQDPYNIDQPHDLDPSSTPFFPSNKGIMDVLDRVIATHPHLIGGHKHSCSYCGISHVESVGQCTQCQKWFCNESGSSTASHLLTHLISSHHRGFKHHCDSSNNDVDLECYFCSTRNIFLLGTINTKEDNIVAIVCRSPCLLSPKLKEQNFDISSWSSIIQQKKFVPWLLHPVPVDQGKNAVPVTTGIINKLEELWKTNPDATIQDLYYRMINLGKITQLPDAFTHSIDYANAFHSLVNIEAESDKLLKSQQYQEGLSVQWITHANGSNGSTTGELISLDTYLDEEANNRIYGHNDNDDDGDDDDKKKVKKNSRKNKNNKNGDNSTTSSPDVSKITSLLGPNKRLFASFTVIQEEETSLKIFAGDELILTYGDPSDLGKGSWVGTGFAVKVSITGEVIMSIDESCLATAPIDQIHGYKAQTAWKSVTYDRMHDALRKFAAMTSLVNKQAVEADQERRAALHAEGGVDDSVTTISLKGNTAKDAKKDHNGKNNEQNGRNGKKNQRNRNRNNNNNAGKNDPNSSTFTPNGDEDGDENTSCMSLNLYHQLLGLTHSDEGLKLPIPTELKRLPHLPVLNEYQEQAIKMALSQTLTLLQGPPGTGKTTTCAYLIYHLHQALLQRAVADQKEQKLTAMKKVNPILVCAPSNIAVDHLAEKLHLAGLKVVRVAARSRQNITSTVDFLSLHVLVGQLAIRAKSGRFFELYQLVTNNPLSLTHKQRLEYKQLIHSVSIAILQNADVICTTCTSLGDNRLFSSFQFEHVLIDEATQCPEPEILIPVTNGAKQVILVGDHCQLGPVVLSKHAAKAGYNRSLFERLLLRGHTPKMLQIQYRMHPEIAKFPANTFYDGNLTNGIKIKERSFSSNVFPWPNPSVPLCFIASTGSIEEYSASGTSFINRYELTLIEKCLLYLVTRGVTLGQIGIITPYEGQRLHLMTTLTRQSSPVLQYLSQRAAQEVKNVDKVDKSDKNGANPSISGTAFDSLTALNNLEIASVDSFQGREKDIILFTCVRSNEHNELGFLSDPRRLNVALTRAKYGMIMVGNPKVLLKNPLWHALLCHFKLQKCFVQGGLDLDNLKPCTLIIPPSRTFLNARSVRIPVGFDPKTSFGMANVMKFNRSHQKVFHSNVAPQPVERRRNGDYKPQRADGVGSQLYYQPTGGNISTTGDNNINNNTNNTTTTSNVNNNDLNDDIDADLAGSEYDPARMGNVTAALPTSLGR